MFSQKRSKEMDKDKLRDYKRFLSEEFSSQADIEKTSEEKVFIDYMIDLLDENEEAPELARCYFSCMQGSRKIEIDGYGYNEDEETYILVLSKYDTDEDLKTITSTEINQLKKFMEAFVDNSISRFIQNNVEFSSNGKEIANDLYRKYINDNIQKFKFYIFTNSRLSDRVTVLNPDPIHGKKLEVKVWDLEGIFNSDSNNRKKEEITVEVSKGLPCIKAFEDSVAGYSSYLAVIPGTLLAEIYDIHGSRLLEKNVRDFLTFSGKVNKGIRGTIKNQPEYFFTFNNGIATTAKEIEVKLTTNGMTITKIKDFQIINGGQTTASIFYTRYKDKADLSKVFVPMKLTVLDVIDNSSEIIEKISKFSNTQNKVTDADFFSNSPFHRYFKQLSEEFLAPAVKGNQRQTFWFYERTKSSYRTSKMRLTKTQVEIFESQKPKNQVISKTDLAKYFTIYNLMPNVVASGSVHYLRKFAEYISSFNDVKTEVNEYFFKKSIALAIIFKESTILVKNQDWHESGNSYSASIVYYTISKLLYLIKVKHPSKTIDYLQIWNRQTMQQELISSIVDLSRQTFEYLNSDEREIENVFHWSRSSRCWEKYKNIPHELSVSLINSLVRRDIEEEHIKLAKKKQRFGSRVDGEIFVISKGSNFWIKLFEKAEGSLDITHIDRMDLDALIKYYTTGRAPFRFAEIAQRLLIFIDRCNDVSIDTSELIKLYSENPKDKEIE
jgi:hypothetical protein